MTSPDKVRPAKAQSPTTVGGYLQGVDPAGEGAQNNLWLTQQLEHFRTNLISGILSGFQNIGGAVDQAISAISLALSGAPGGLEALETWAEGLPIFGDALELITGKPDADPNDFASYMLGLVKALRGIDPGAEFGVLQLIFGQQQQTVVVANDALVAATAANNSVRALLSGGVRTIHTSNFTYTKPANLVKLGVLIMNGGGAGVYGDYAAQGGIGGGAIYQEFDGTLVPATVDGIIGSGRPGGTSTIQQPNPTSFGNLLTGPLTNKGLIVSSSLPNDAQNAAPGSGGRSGINNDNPDGTDGGSSALAAGGLGGNVQRIVGGNGANAPTDREFLAGGGGGGGGRALTQIGASSGPGGAGGFPGGAGGGGGRDSISRWNGGPGAPGLLATIEFLA